MKKYYLHNGKEQDGPFDISDLKAKKITPATEVWYEGLPDWKAADQIEELKVLFTRVTPPPIKSKSSYSDKKSASDKNILRISLIAIAVIIGVYIINLMISDNSDPASYLEQKLTVEEIENNNPTRFLSADGKYNSSFWGTELKIRGHITNTATVADYQDVTVRVTYYSKTQSVLGSKEYTLYEVYEPNSVTPFRLDIENYKDVDAIGWEVIRAIPNYR